MKPRRPVPSELAAVAGLLAQEGWSGWTPTALGEVLPRDDRGLWVVTVEQRIVGVMLAQWILDEGEVLAVAVAPSHRRCGLGRALVRALLDRLTEAGVAQVWLEVRAGNLGALAFYAEQGFRVVGRRTRFYGHEDALLMARPIGR